MIDKANAKGLGSIYRPAGIYHFLGIALPYQFRKPVGFRKIPE